MEEKGGGGEEGVVVKGEVKEEWQKNNIKKREQKNNSEIISFFIVKLSTTLSSSHLSLPLPTLSLTWQTAHTSPGWCCISVHCTRAGPMPFPPGAAVLLLRGIWTT